MLSESIKKDLKKKKVTRMMHRNALAEHWMGGGGTKEIGDE